MSFRLRREIELRDEPLHEAGGEDREMDVRRAHPVVVSWVRIGARHNRAEAIAALGVGQHPTPALEVGSIGASVMSSGCSYLPQRFAARPRSAPSSRAGRSRRRPGRRRRSVGARASPGCIQARSSSLEPTKPSAKKGPIVWEGVTTRTGLSGVRASWTRYPLMRSRFFSPGNTEGCGSGRLVFINAQLALAPVSLITLAQRGVSQRMYSRTARACPRRSRTGCRAAAAVLASLRMRTISR